MSANSLARRLEKLERPQKLPGSCLFLSQSDVPVTRWRGSCGSVHRSWNIRLGETAEDFQARAQREALPLGIMCILGFPEDETNVSA